ncbi:MAG: hypothetical protein JW940_21435 [Polyangiaceae bacterium]|nr:hypothetical protein [Polyangiaceae bacterium]
MRYASIARFSLLLMVTSCTYGSTHELGWDDIDVEHPTVEEAAIQTDGTMTDIVPGRGAGIFIEHASDGEWAVTVACDTERSGLACEWDVYARPLGADDLVLVGPELPTEDWAVENREGGISYQTTTSDELDQLWFVGAPREAVSFYVLLDARFIDRDTAPERFVYWVGEAGVLHAGAPSNPIELVPTGP